MPAMLERTMVGVTVEDQVEGAQFTNVPTHITVLPWMDLAGVEDDFMTSAEGICAESAFLSINPWREDYVMLAGDNRYQWARSDSLMYLHYELFELADRLGVKIQNQDQFGDYYRPHLTNACLTRSFIVRSLAVIVERAREDGSQMKTVEALLPLGVNL